MMATNDIKAFVEQSTSLMAAAKKIATALAPNTVQVWPGGATFNTIAAAMNSISGASPQEQYQVAVGPGTYKENVVMVDYVYLVGAGQDVTIITAPPQQQFAAGVVNSASGGGISEVTLDAPGGAWGTCPTGIKIVGAGNFHISGVTINSGAGGDGDNIRGITNNTGSYTGNVIVGSCIFNCTGDSQSAVVGIELFGWQGEAPFNMTINLSAIQSTDGSQNIGVAASNGCNVLIEESKAIGNVWSLYADTSCTFTANQCTLVGPVSSNIVVNN